MSMLNIVAQTMLLFSLLSKTLSYTFHPSQVPYMRGYYIITPGQYIFFQIFRVIQTSRIWIVCMCKYPTITIFALFDK
jgi:hypothetical protein